MERGEFLIERAFDLGVLVVNALVAWWVAKKYGDMAATRYEIKHAEKQSQKAALAFRTALGDEIDHNIGQLKKLWDNIDRSASPVAPNAVTPHTLAAGFMQVAMPEWNTEIWKRQQPRLLESLGNKSREIRALYADLTEVSVMHDKLQHLWDQERADSTRVAISGVARGPFSMNAPQLWRECEATVKRILDRGNPLLTEAKR